MWVRYFRDQTVEYFHFPIYSLPFTTSNTVMFTFTSSSLPSFAALSKSCLKKIIEDTRENYSYSYQSSWEVDKQLIRTLSILLISSSDICYKHKASTTDINLICLIQIHTTENTPKNNQNCVVHELKCKIVDTVSYMKCNFANRSQLITLNTQRTGCGGHVHTKP